MIGEATFHATARFEDGKTTVKITAVTPYGDRSTSTVREIEDPKAVEAFEQLFKKAIDSAAEEMKRHSFNEAARNIHEQKPHVRVKNYDELQKEREAKAKQVRAELGSGKTTKEK
jgi:hypothetical protein